MFACQGNLSSQGHFSEGSRSFGKVMRYYVAGILKELAVVEYALLCALSLTLYLCSLWSGDEKKVWSHVLDQVQ